jgi:dihydroorotate dehydrogenase (NAD+) catalytic subunit
MPKFELILNPPIMNAAGSLGFAPDPHGRVDLSRLGAFVTNPVSMKPRTPAQGQRYLDFAGGFLLHTGYPNPGLKSVLRRYAKQWQRAAMPILVHLLGQNADEIFSMVQQVEQAPGVMGVEIGLPPDVEAEEAALLAQAAVGELPVVVRLPLDRAKELLRRAGPAFLEAGATAASLGPPRGALHDPKGSLVHGRLYGPSLYPLVLEILQYALRLGLPMIAAGGVYRSEEVEALLAAGAAAVQLDAVLWKGGEWSKI